MLSDIVKERLTTALQPTHLDIIDESAEHLGHGASGAHFAIQLISPLFVGKSTVTRHRMIYTALSGLIGGEIHAIQITAKAPNET